MDQWCLIASHHDVCSRTFSAARSELQEARMVEFTKTAEENIVCAMAMLARLAADNPDGARSCGLRQVDPADFGLV